MRAAMNTNGASATPMSRPPLYADGTGAGPPGPSPPQKPPGQVRHPNTLCRISISLGSQDERISIRKRRPGGVLMDATCSAGLFVCVKHRATILLCYCRGMEALGSHLLGPTRHLEWYRPRGCTPRRACRSTCTGPRGFPQACPRGTLGGPGRVCPACRPCTWAPRPRSWACPMGPLPHSMGCPLWACARLLGYAQCFTDLFPPVSH